MELLWMLPLVALLLYALCISLKYPHVRRIAVRELNLRKFSSVLVIVGLSVCIALITLVFCIRYAFQERSNAYLEKPAEAIKYEVMAIHQPHLQKPYFTDEDMGDLLATDEGDPNIWPIVSYAVTLFPASELDQDVILPNVLVIGVDPAVAKSFNPEGSKADWPSTLGENRIVLSESAADRLNARAGDYVQLLDHHNRKHAFQVEQIQEDEGLLAYRGFQKADATAIISLERARSLFDLPSGSYTSAIGDLHVPPPWHSRYIQQDTPLSLEGVSSFGVYFFGIINSTAIAMAIILTINLFRLIAEERRFGTGVMRSIGFSRLDLKRILRLEGLCYALFSGLLGSAAGTGLAAWVMGSNRRLFGQEMWLDQIITWQTGLKAMLTGCSIGTCILFGSVWMVSQISLRNSAQTEPVGAIRRAPSKGAYAFHYGFSFIILTLTLSLVVLISIPEVRQSWFDGVDLLLWSAGLFLVIPLLIYGAVWWLEWGVGLVLWLSSKVPACYAMLNLALNQLKGHRIRTGLLMLMFCLVCCFVSFSTVLSNYIHVVVTQSGNREATGGYDYFAEDARVIASEQLKSYLDEIGYPEERYPEYASVVRLPWRESEWRGFEINGVDRRYAQTNRLSVTPRREGDGDGASLWNKLASDPDAVIVSTSTLSFIESQNWKRDNDEIVFRINGQTIRKRIIGVANEGTNEWNAGSIAYPATIGIWMNEQEVLRLGRNAKELNSVLLLRFDSAAIGREWQERSELGLARFNVYPLRSAVDEDVWFYRDVGLLFALFEKFNYLAMAIGIAGLAVVMARLVKMRKRQLGVLRTLGIAPNLLQLYVVAEGVLLSIFGSSLGFVVGGYYGYVLCKSQISDMVLGFRFGFPIFKLLLLFISFAILILVSNLWSVRYVYRVSPIESTKHLTS
ncbi:ABC transporter permease [Cohnella cholangitidis]|nr:FtsX-like permease family protein [Cohnella cholangitidis]